MNLENLYGSHKSLMKVFESALQQNEPIEVFMRLVAIYEQSNKMEASIIAVILKVDISCTSFMIQLADQLYQTMTKKFGNTLRVWTQYGTFLMTRRKVEAARNLLQRSLKILTSKQDRKFHQ